MYFLSPNFGKLSECENNSKTIQGSGSFVRLRMAVTPLRERLSLLL